MGGGVNSATLGEMSLWGGVGSAVSNVISAYYSGKIANIEMQSQASAYQFQQQLAEINAQQLKKYAELMNVQAEQAQKQSYSIRQQGEAEQAYVGLGYQQEIENTKAQQASNGVAIGYGSSGEVISSQKWTADTNLWSMSMKTLVKAQEAEREATNYRLQGVGIEGNANNQLMSAISNRTNASIATSNKNNSALLMLRAGFSEGMNFFKENRDYFKTTSKGRS